MDGQEWNVPWKKVWLPDGTRLMDKLCIKGLVVGHREKGKGARVLPRPLDTQIHTAAFSHPCVHCHVDVAFASGEENGGSKQPLMKPL